MLTRCSTRLQHGDGGEHGDPIRVKSRSPWRWSSDRGRRISSDASTPPTSRWNFSAAAARRASATPEERGRLAESWAAGSPLLVAGDVDQVGLGLDQDRAERGEGTEEGPLPVDAARCHRSAARRPKPTSSAASDR